MVIINFSFDLNNRYEVPTMELCNPNKKQLCMLVNLSDINMTLRFGACSELSFVIYREYNGVANPYYDRVQKNRLIHIDGFGYFVIDNCVQTFGNKVPSKEVKAYSAEYLLNNKGVNLTFITSGSSTHTYSKSYKFWDILTANQPETLLGQLIQVAPQWSVGYVSPSLCSKFRSFDVTDDGLYGFLVNKVSASYEALFVFDNENYTVSAYDTTEIVKPTDIVLTFENVTKDITIEELNNDIYTVLNVNGAENLSIARINPNGTKKIYALDYYVGSLDINSENYYLSYDKWIDDVVLRKKVLDWQKLTKDSMEDISKGSYGWLISTQKNCNKLLLSQNARYVDCKNEFEIAQSNFALYSNDTTTPMIGSVTTCRNYYNMLQQALEHNMNALTDGGRLYITTEAVMKTKTSLGNPDGYYVIAEIVDDNLTPPRTDSYFAISALNAEIASLAERREQIVSQYGFDTYFTVAEQLELEPYLREGNFQDDSFIVTDTMRTADYSDSEQYVETTSGLKKIKDLSPTDVILDETYIVQQLLAAGYEKLEQVCQPSYSFSMNALNFLFVEKFKPFVMQLAFGAQLNVEVEEGVWVYPYLQEISFSFSDADNFSMQFGNRFRLSTAEWTWAELHNETSNAVNSVGTLLSATALPVVNGTVDKLTDYINTSLIAANQSIQSTTDNEFSFGGYGIRGRKKSDEAGNVNGYSKEQIWISNNKINFTNDGWATTKAVFGQLADGTYGLIAESIIGNLIAGNELTISNAGNNFTLNATGATLTNASLSVSNEQAEIIINPSNGIKIHSKAENKDVFYVDTVGKLIADDVYVTAKDSTNQQSLSSWMKNVEKALSDAASGISQAQAAAQAAANAAYQAQNAANAAANAAYQAQNAANAAAAAAATAQDGVNKANAAQQTANGKLNATTAAVNALYNQATFTASGIFATASLSVGGWITTASRMKYSSELGGYVALWVNN